MAFIRTKVVKGHKYYQLVENYRDKERNGKHRQRVIHHLGKYVSVEQKLRTLRTKEAGERRTAAARQAEVELWIERLGRWLICSQEGPQKTRDPVDESVYFLMEDAITRAKEEAGIPPDSLGIPGNEWPQILASASEQTGLNPSEVESRWRRENARRRRGGGHFTEEEITRCISVGRLNMPSAEEIWSKYQEFMKKVRNWEKARDTGGLTQEESDKQYQHLFSEWMQELHIEMGYYQALERLLEHEYRADDYQHQINELLEIQQKYPC